MKAAAGLVKRAGSDAVGAIRPVCRPEAKACLGIDRPAQHTIPVGDIIGLFRWLTIHNRLAGTFFSTLLTHHAKIPNSEFDRFIGNEGQIRKNLGQSNPGAEYRCDQQAVAGKLSQTGINRYGNAAGRIIAARYGLIPQPSDIMSEQTGYKRHF